MTESMRLKLEEMRIAIGTFARSAEESPSRLMAAVYGVIAESDREASERVSITAKFVQLVSHPNGALYALDEVGGVWVRGSGTANATMWQHVPDRRQEST